MGRLAAQLAQIVDPIVRRPLGQLFRLAIAVPYRADLHAGAAARLHVRRRIADEQAVFGPRPQRVQRHEDDIRRRLRRKTIRALHVIEILEQAEQLKHAPRRRRAFRGGRGLASRQVCQRLGNPGVKLGRAVIASRVDSAVFLDQRIDRAVLEAEILKQIEQVAADVGLQEIEADLPAGRRIRSQHLLHGPADVQRRVEQRAVDVEKIYRKARYAHAGCGRSPSMMPGNRRPPSGRSTCCVSPDPGPAGRVNAGSGSPSISCLTSAPSSTSRSSSASAIRTMASARSSIIFRARSYPSCTSFFTCWSIFSAVSSLKSRCCAISRPRKICSSFLPKLSGPSSLMPHSQTILRARSVARSISFPAPVVIWCMYFSSAMRPAMRIASCIVTPSAMPRGMIVTLCSGSAFGSTAATSAWPASWYAVFRFSASLRI